MLENIYIARHGFRQGFDWPTSPTGTKRDPPLTAFGITQAKELAQYFVDNRTSASLDLIFSSPYYRCLQTASYTAEELGLPILVEFGISEFFQTVVPGTGLHPRPPLASSLTAYFPIIAHDSHTPLLFAPREGETIAEIHARAHTFLALFIAHVDTTYPDARSVLLVSHAATVITLGRALSGDKEKDVRAGTCSLSHYRRRRRSNTDGKGGKKDEWECILNGSTAHLKGGEERHWDFSQIEEDMQEEGLGMDAEEKAHGITDKPKL